MLSFKIIGLLVPEKNILKVFTIYGHDGHLGHVTWNVYINFRSLHMTLALIGQAVSEMFENNSHAHVYSPGAWGRPPGVKIVSKHNSSVSLLYTASLTLKMTL